MFDVVKQFSSGPVKDGAVTVQGGLVASEFLVAGLVLHGVNVAAEALAFGR